MSKNTKNKSLIILGKNRNKHLCALQYVICEYIETFAIDDYCELFKIKPNYRPAGIIYFPDDDELLKIMNDQREICFTDLKLPVVVIIDNYDKQIFRKLMSIGASDCLFSPLSYGEIQMSIEKGNEKIRQIMGMS